MKVGFIGLGNMGRPMVRRLLKAGYSVVVHSRSPGPAQELAREGAVPAFSPQEVAASCDTVLTCVTLPSDTDAVYLGPRGLIPHARPGHLFIEHSTIGPQQARRLYNEAKVKSASFLDAPVSGGVQGATEGTLAIMVGGEQEAFDRAKPVLNVLGKYVRLAGPSGAGAVVKLVNQMLVAINLAGAVEGLVLATRAGVDPTVTMEVLKNSTGSSATLLSAGSRMLERDFAPRFALKLLLKDMRLVAEVGNEAGVRLLAGALAREFVAEGCAAGYGEQDIAAVVRPLEELVGVTVG